MLRTFGVCRLGVLAERLWPAIPLGLGAVDFVRAGI